jgi:hypothetical protein
MARGRVRAIGSSIRLKQKFGAGYVLAVSPVGAAHSYTDLPALAAAVGKRAASIKEFVRCGRAGLGGGWGGWLGGWEGGRVGGAFGAQNFGRELRDAR